MAHRDVFFENLLHCFKYCAECVNLISMYDRNFEFFSKPGRRIITALFQVKPEISEHKEVLKIIVACHTTFCFSRFISEMKKRSMINFILFTIFDYARYNKNIDGFHINDLLQQLPFHCHSYVIIDYWF